MSPARATLLTTALLLAPLEASAESPPTKLPREPGPGAQLKTALKSPDLGKLRGECSPSCSGPEKVEYVVSAVHLERRAPRVRKPSAPERESGQEQSPPADGSEDAPFSTLQAALDAARSVDACQVDLRLLAMQPRSSARPQNRRERAPLDAKRERSV